MGVFRRKLFWMWKVVNIGLLHDIVTLTIFAMRWCHNSYQNKSYICILETLCQPDVCQFSKKNKEFNWANCCLFACYLRKGWCALCQSTTCRIVVGVLLYIFLPSPLICYRSPLIAYRSSHDDSISHWGTITSKAPKAHMPYLILAKVIFILRQKIIFFMLGLDTQLFEFGPPPLFTGEALAKM